MIATLPLPITKRQGIALVIGVSSVTAVGLTVAGWLGAVAVVASCAAALLVVVIFRQPFAGLIATVVALPFERVGALEFGGLTLRASQILLIITLVAWLLDGMMRRRLKIFSNPLLVPLLLLVLVNLLSLTQAVNLTRSIVVLTATIVTILMCLLVPQLVTTTEKAKRIIRALIFVTGAVTVFGIYQFIGDLIGLPTGLTGLRDLYTKEVFGFPRIQGTASEPLYFVNFLILPISLISAFLLSRQRVMSTLVLVGVLALGIINVVLALSRAGWAALAVSLLIIGGYYFRKIFSPRQLLISILVLAVTVGVFVRVFRLTDDVDLSVQKFVTQAGAVFQGASYSDRVSTFADAAAAWRNHPWLGVGVGNFGPVVAPFPTIEPVGGWLIVNNIFLEIAAETGIFGLALFVLILGLLFFRTVKAISTTQSPWLKSALVGSLAAFIGVIIQYQTFSILFIMHIWFLFGWLVALQNLVLAKEAQS